VSNENNDQYQRTVRAIILCVLVAIVYTQVFLAPKRKPTAAPPAAGQAPVAAVVTPGVSQLQLQPVQPAQVVASAPVIQQHPSKAELEAQPSSFVETSDLRVVVSHLGARLASVKLKQYRVEQGAESPLDMVDNPEGTAMPLGVYLGSESDERVVYQLTSINGVAATSPANLQVAPGSEVVLEFSGTLASGTGITKRLTVKDNSYLLSLDVALTRPSPDGTPAWVEWTHFYLGEQHNPRIKLTHLTYLDGFDKLRHVQLSELQPGLRDFGTSKWASLGDIYFMATLIPTVGGRNTMLGRYGDVYVTRVAGTARGGKFDMYVGPKDYRTLQYVGGYRLDRAIDLGWFTFLALPLLWLLHYLYVVLQNYGLAIIALTLLVKAALLPLSKAGFASMKKMQEVQPEIKALRERIKDPTTLNQEIFGLYQRKGINPMGGCLPMVIQVPVFLGLYQALLNSIELRHSPFALWITDLSAPEKLQLFGIGVPVMVLLMAASMIVQQWTTPNPSADPAQQKMMMVMPVVFAVMFIIFPMPAGLVLYWLVSNVISITQQTYMRNANKGSVYTATAVASAGIFALGYILTLV
jgi:YidC/Oxa1 family membrane protein insertase